MYAGRYGRTDSDAAHTWRPARAGHIRARRYGRTDSLCTRTAQLGPNQCGCRLQDHDRGI